MKKWGAAWSIFRDMPDEWRVPFFVIISVVAVGVIAHLYRKADHTLTRWSLMLILGGAGGGLHGAACSPAGPIHQRSAG